MSLSFKSQVATVTTPSTCQKPKEQELRGGTAQLLAVAFPVRPSLDLLRTEAGFSHSNGRTFCKLVFSQQRGCVLIFWWRGELGRDAQCIEALSSISRNLTSVPCVPEPQLLQPKINHTEGRLQTGVLTADSCFTELHPLRSRFPQPDGASSLSSPSESLPHLSCLSRHAQFSGVHILPQLCTSSCLSLSSAEITDMHHKSQLPNYCCSLCEVQWSAATICWLYFIASTIFDTYTYMNGQINKSSSRFEKFLNNVTRNWVSWCLFIIHTLQRLRDRRITWVQR